MNPAEDLLRASLFDTYRRIANLGRDDEHAELVAALERYGEELETAIMFGFSVHDAIGKMRLEP